MQTLFRYRGKHHLDATTLYGGIAKKEFYSGELEAESCDLLDLAIYKSLGHPMSIIRLTNRSALSFRRTLQHIRADRVDVRVLWFVRRGSLKIVRAGTTDTVNAGQFTIVDSSIPFYLKIFEDDKQIHESIQAIIPAHLFFSQFGKVDPSNLVVDTSYSAGKTVTKLLNLLFGDGDELSRRTVEPLIASFLASVGDCLAQSDQIPINRVRLVDKRLNDILSFMMAHLTDPELTCQQVADGCGISRRYLIHLLNANKMAFSRLLWSKRLEKAHEWLVSSGMKSYSIYEIAYMAGFKSAAHFSRAFKAEFGISPRPYRAKHLLVSQPDIGDEARAESEIVSH